MRVPKRLNKTRWIQPDKEWLKTEYWIKGKSANAIAREQGTWPDTILRWLRNNDIKLRSPKELARRHSEKMTGSNNPSWNGDPFGQYARRMLMANGDPMCAWCEATKADIPKGFGRSFLEVHHANHNRRDNRPENLMILCNSCNRLESFLWSLQSRGRATFHVDEEAHRLTVEFTT